MKKFLILKYHYKLGSFVNRRLRGCRAIILLSLLTVVLGSCGGGGDTGSPPNTTPPSVTDTSGDFAITVRVDSSTQISVSWADPTKRYALRPESAYSKVFRDGAEIVSSTGIFDYQDAGLLPLTTYCYRTEVIAVYQYFFPGSYITVGWSSGTACIATTAL